MVLLALMALCENIHLLDWDGVVGLKSRIKVLSGVVASAQESVL